jgi:vacuolar-type H+-ATPase subunit C/Vma6
MAEVLQFEADRRSINITLSNDLDVQLVQVLVAQATLEVGGQRCLDQYRVVQFLDMTYGYMIDNIALLITGTLHERDTRELLERCHPLGWFETLPVLCQGTWQMSPSLVRTGT